MKTQHTPGPWQHKTSYPPMGGMVFEINSPSGNVLKIRGGCLPVAADAALIATAPELLAALKGCLAQLEGPAMIYGDGRGNDGLKTGLSHQEFIELLDGRLEAARAAIAKARGDA